MSIEAVEHMRAAHLSIKAAMESAVRRMDTASNANEFDEAVASRETLQRSLDQVDRCVSLMTKELGEPKRRMLSFMRALHALCADRRVDISGVFALHLDGVESDASVTDLRSVTSEGIDGVGASAGHGPSR